MPEYDWDKWEKAARADAEEHHKAHQRSLHLDFNPRCPDCVRVRDRHVSEVLAPEEAAP